MSDWMKDNIKLLEQQRDINNRVGSIVNDYPDIATGQILGSLIASMIKESSKDCVKYVFNKLVDSVYDGIQSGDIVVDPEGENNVD